MKKYFSPLIAVALLWLCNFKILDFYSRAIEDDAYGHMVIARNLIQHGLPYFNVNENVMPSASIGWHFVLAVAFKLFGATVFSVTLVQSFFLTALIGVVYLILKKVHLIGTALLWTAFIAYSIALPLAVGGMEVIATVTLLLSAYLLIKNEKPLWAAVFLAFAVYFRSEAVIFILCSLPFLWKKRSIWAVFILFGCFYLGYCLLFYGTFLQQSILAKTAVGNHDHFVFPFLLFTMRWQFPVLFKNANFILLKIMEYSYIFWTVGIITSLIIYYRIFFLSKKMNISLVNWAFLSASLILALVYDFGPIPPSAWYIAIVVIPFVVIAASSIKNDWIIYLCLILGNGHRAIEAYVHLGGWLAGDKLAAFDAPISERCFAYSSIVQNLLQKDPEKNSVLTIEPGAMKWFNDVQIVDGMGLFSAPEAIEYQSKYIDKNQKFYLPQIPPEIVLLKKPDFIVSYKTYFPYLMEKINTEPEKFPYELLCTVKVPPYMNVAEDHIIYVYRRVSDGFMAKRINPPEIDLSKNPSAPINCI